MTQSNVQLFDSVQVTQKKANKQKSDFFNSQLSELNVSIENLEFWATIETHDGLEKRQKVSIVRDYKDTHGVGFEILYPTLEGSLLQYTTKTKNGTHQPFYSNIRLSDSYVQNYLEKNGTQLGKYKKPSGVGSPVFIPIPIINKFQNSLKISTLYITEGEKKAIVGAANGLDVVAVSGIWNFRNTDTKQLKNEIIEICNRCEVERIVFLYDKDALQVRSASNELNNYDVTSRLQSFLSAANSFKKSVLASNIKASIHAAYITHSERKGLDDLINNVENFSDYIKEFDISKSTYALDSEFCIHNVNDFLQKYSSELENETFLFNKIKVKNVTLQHNEFISNHLDISDFGMGINVLRGGMGTGKSKLIAKLGLYKKTIVVSRNITTLENLECEGFFRFLLSDKKNDFIELQNIDFKRITVTYKSFENLLSVIDISDYIIVFDESQQLIESYKEVSKETRFCYEKIKELQKTNIVILASANDVKISTLQIVNFFNFKKEAKRNINLSYNANYQQLRAVINERLSEKDLVILHIEKKEKANAKDDFQIIESIKEDFKHIEIEFFDSTKHNKINLDNLTCKLLVTTSALTTGKDLNYNNLAMICYKESAHNLKNQIVQFFGRARAYQLASFDLLFSFSDNQNRKAFNCDFNKKMLFQNAQSAIDSGIDSDFELMYEEYKIKFDEKISKWVVDAFAIDNFIEKKHSLSILSNSKNMIKFLESQQFYAQLSEVSEVSEKSELSEKSDNIAVYNKELAIIENNSLDSFEFVTTAKERFELFTTHDFSKYDTLNLLNLYASRVKFSQLFYLLLIEQSLSKEKTKRNKMIIELSKKLNNDYFEFNQIAAILSSFKTLSYKEASTKINECVKLSKQYIKLKDSDKKQAIIKQRTVLKLLSSHFLISKQRLNSNFVYSFELSDYSKDIVLTKEFFFKMKSLFDVIKH